MWIERLTYSPTTHAVELAAQFAEQRQKLLATNVANIDTPNYVTRQLDPQAFQASLKDALERSQESSGRGLELRGNAQFSTGADGRVEVRPVEEPAENVLFHDGTNVRLEQLLTDVSDNALMYELSTNLLRGRFTNLLQAIRGSVA